MFNCVCTKVMIIKAEASINSIHVIVEFSLCHYSLFPSSFVVLFISDTLCFELWMMDIYKIKAYHLVHIFLGSIIQI
jgi:hypothetical protein